MGKGIAFVDGHSVGDTIARVQHNTSGTTRGVQREHSLDGDVHGGRVEGLEHDLSHLLSVGLGVERSLSEKDGVLLRGHTQLIVEGVMPDLLHVVPVGHDSVLNGVLEGQDASLGLSLIAYVGVLLAHADHDASVSGSANNGREHSARGIIAGKASLAHARTVVNHQSLHFVAHCTKLF